MRHDFLVLADTIPCRPLEPCRESLVQPRPIGLRQRQIRRITDEDVPEPIRVSVGDVGALRSQQFPPHKRHEHAYKSIGTHVAAELCDRGRLKGPPDHRTVLKHRSLRAFELVEASRQERMDARGDVKRCRDLVQVPGSVALVEGAAVPQHRDHLLEEQRIPIRGRDDALPQLGWQLVTSKLVADDRVRCGAVQGRQVQVRPGPSPARSTIEQLGPSRGNEQDRPGSSPGDVLEKVKERVVRPVQILDEQGEGRAVGGMLEHPTGRPEQLVLALGRCVEPDERGQWLDHLVRRLERVETLAHLARGVALVDARQLVEDLADRPVRDAVAIRKASALCHRRAAGERGRQLAQQPALADTRRRHHGDQADRPG